MSLLLSLFVSVVLYIALCLPLSLSLSFTSRSLSLSLCWCSVTWTAGPRKDKYNKKILKYHVDVEEESEDYEHDEEKEQHEDVAEAARMLQLRKVRIDLIKLYINPYRQRRVKLARLKVGWPSSASERRRSSTSMKRKMKSPRGLRRSRPPSRIVFITGLDLLGTWGGTWVGTLIENSCPAGSGDLQKIW